MAKRLSRTASRGFSLVEMLVALVFTLILMAGMSAVFKSTLTTFAATGEKLSSARRNRMSLDMVYDDLNNAGMYLVDLTSAPAFSTANEGFRVVPDPMAQAGTPIPGVTQGADELYFYMDEPLPFEGALTSTSARVAGAQALAGQAATATAFTYLIECKDVSYANLVKPGQVILFKDSFDSGYVNSVTPTGSSVTVVLGADPMAAISGSGLSGEAPRFQHITASGTTPGCGVVFVRPAQMVRYSLQALSLDPASTTASTLCLVRDQGTYSTAGFTPDPNIPQQVVTENIAGFRVYLSADSGRNWVGGPGYNSWAAIKTGLDTQLSTSGRTGYTSLGTNLNWFRSTPVLVRVDVTTRTAVQRAEYSPGNNTLAYKEQLQSIVMVPRHFGLSIN
ncbi:MAG: hypothetical protein HGA66_02055 [Holophaga sp.]|nr:hypothetical protein [Holophaga sp.]